MVLYKAMYRLRSLKFGKIKALYSWLDLRTKQTLSWNAVFWKVCIFWETVKKISIFVFVLLLLFVCLLFCFVLIWFAFNDVPFASGEIEISPAATEKQIYILRTCGNFFQINWVIQYAKYVMPRTVFYGQMGVRNALRSPLRIAIGVDTDFNTDCRNNEQSLRGL